MSTDRPVIRLSRPAPGIYACCICFEYRSKDELVVDTDGQAWDVCKGVCATQAGITEAAVDDGR